MLYYVLLYGYIILRLHNVAVRSAGRRRGGRRRTRRGVEEGGLEAVQEVREGRGAWGNLGIL